MDQKQREFYERYSEQFENQYKTWWLSEGLALDQSLKTALEPVLKMTQDQLEAICWVWFLNGMIASNELAQQDLDQNERNV
jgi:hypothetical protein